MKIEVDIPIPEGSLDEGAKDRVQRAALEAAVLRLFDERRISSAEAARDLCLTRIGFMELAQQRGVPMYDYTLEDWEEDKKDLERLRPVIEENVRESSARRLK